MPDMTEEAYDTLLQTKRNRYPTSYRKRCYCWAVWEGRNALPAMVLRGKNDLDRA